MPLADLHLYQIDTARRGFPGRRLELLLAQVALVLAQVNGVKDLKLKDFMVNPEPEQGPQVADDDADQEEEFFGFNPRNLHRVRDNTDGQ